MAEKNSEAIQKEIADFTAKLEAGAPKKAGQKSTKGAKKEPPKGKKGAPMKQAPVPISSVEVAPVTDAAGTSDDAITAFIKTLPVSLDYDQVEHNVLKKFLLLKPGAALTTLIKTVMESMQPKDEDDKTITDFILGLPDGLDELGVIEKLFEEYPQLPPSVHLKHVVNEAIAAKLKVKQEDVEAAAKAQINKALSATPYPSWIELTEEQFEPIKDYMVEKAKGKTPFDLAAVANKFKVKYDDNLKHLWATIQQGVKMGIELSHFDVKVIDQKKIHEQAKEEIAKLLAAMNEAKAAKGQPVEYTLGNYGPFLKKVAEMVGVLAETAEYDVPPNDIILIKEGDKYVAMTTEDALKFSIQKAGSLPPPGMLDGIAKAFAGKITPSNVIGQQPQVNLNISIDDVTAGAVNHLFEMINKLLAFNLQKTSEGLQEMNEHLGELDTFVHGQLDNLKDMIMKAEQPVESEELEAVSKKLDFLEKFVNNKFAAMNMNLGKLAKQVKQKK